MLFGWLLPISISISISILFLPRFSFCASKIWPTWCAKSSANTSHVVHELTFGPRLPPRMLRKIPKSVKDNIDPLAGHAFVNREPHMSHEHYIKIVSTVYEVGTLIGHDEVLGYQVRDVTIICFRGLQFLENMSQPSETNDELSSLSCVCASLLRMGEKTNTSINFPRCLHPTINTMPIPTFPWRNSHSIYRRQRS